MSAVRPTRRIAIAIINSIIPRPREARCPDRRLRFSVVIIIVSNTSGSPPPPAVVRIGPLLNASRGSHGHRFPALSNVVLKKNPVRHRTALAVADTASCDRFGRTGQAFRAEGDRLPGGCAVLRSQVRGTASEHL